VRLDVPVLLALTVAAAAVQTALPHPQWMVMKPPLLAAVAAYYALSRELPLALTAALWSGAATDVCSGFPFPLTAGFLLVVCVALRSLRRVADDTVWWRGLAVMAVATLLQGVWYGATMGRNGIPLDRFIRGLLGAAGVGAVAGWAVFLVCGWLDGLAGNVKGAVPDDGVPWHNAVL